MLEKRWRTLGGEKIADMALTLREELKAGGKQVHIGTDSQQAKTMTEYVTVIVLLTPSKGGRVFYFREKVPRIRSLRERLHKEVWMSTELGMELTASPDIESDFGVGSILGEDNEMTIHVDVNPDERHKSSAYVQELAGMVASQGFKCLLKPDAWAASHAADHVVKTVVLGK